MRLQGEASALQETRAAADRPCKPEATETVTSVRSASGAEQVAAVRAEEAVVNRGGSRGT